MARKRDPRRDKAFQIWKESNGETKLKDIAAQLNLSEGTLRGWKNKDSWEEQINGTLQSNKRNVPKEETERSKKAGAPKGNKNAVGNNGGAPSGNKNAVGHGAPKGNRNAVGYGAPVRNDNAVTHGLFRKHLPPEVWAIVEQVHNDNISYLDMLMANIDILFAKIMHAQKILFVKDIGDMTKELKREKSMSSDNMDVEEVEYEIQYAWDKEANNIAAFARAMSEFRSHVKEFLLLSGQDDLRRLQLEKMQKEIENLDNSQHDEEGVSSWIDAIKENAEKRRNKKARIKE